VTGPRYVEGGGLTKGRKTPEEQPQHTPRLIAGKRVPNSPRRRLGDIDRRGIIKQYQKRKEKVERNGGDGHGIRDISMGKKLYQEASPLCNTHWSEK